jgi:inorganic pyrophosphatase
MHSARERAPGPGRRAERPQLVGVARGKAALQPGAAKRDLAALPPFDDEDRLRAVVETPRGSAVKLKYAPGLDVFELGRSLPLGVTYPYDFGFVPGTRGADGDPVDVLIIQDAPTFPGVVVACRLLGAVRVSQKDGSRRVPNPRLIAVPANDRRLEDLRGLPPRTRAEIEQFFINVVLFEQKEARVEGWADPAAARTIVDEGRRAYGR